MEKTPITIPPEVLTLLEATAIANGCSSEDIIQAAIAAYLQDLQEEKEQ